MALSIHTVEQLSNLPFITELKILKNELDELRPLAKDIEDRVIQKFRLDWNYHSNAIEGNKLTYGETIAFIMEGITAKGKTLKDHLDIKGHDEAVKFILSLIKDDNYIITESDIRNLHKIILKEPFWADAITAEGKVTKKEIKIGQYKSSPNHVKTPTGETHYYSSPEQTPILMGELMQWFREASLNPVIHPLVLATLFHHEFTAIHPFDDGNGRMARLLMNLILLKNSYPPIVIKQNDRNNYYQVLRQADAGEFIPITEYMNALLKHSLELYIKAAKGESIDEPGDIDKEIELFKKSLGHSVYEVKKTAETTRKFLVDIILPLLNILRPRLLSLSELFLSYNEKISIKSQDHSYMLQYPNIDEFILNHPRTQPYIINDFYYGCFFDGFKKRIYPFNLEYNLRIAFKEAFATMIFNSESSINCIYNSAEQLDETISLATRSIKDLMEIIKRQSDEEK